jgi:iron complex outermembrane receptor protein
MSYSVKQSVRRILRPWVLASLASSVIVGQALAADAAGTTPAPQASDQNSGDAALQEVIVTAQFRRQNLQDTPIAITAVNAATLEQRNETSLSDVTGQAPGVTLLQTGGAFGPGMTATIRGIGQGDFDPALSPGVGLYIDDVYYSNLTGSDFSLVDLDRVEILRGPQGTLSGMNSEGGSIKLYSQKPTGSDTGSVTGGYGSRSLVDLRGMADVSLIKDTLFMRVSVVSKQQDGYVTRVDYGCAFPSSGIASSAPENNCIAGHEGGTDYSGGRVALRWLASDNFEVNLTADGTVDNSQTAAVTLLGVNAAAPGAAVAAGISAPTNVHGVTVPYNDAFVPSNPYVSYANFCAVGLQGTNECFGTDTQSKVWGTNLTMDWKLADDLALKSITAFRELNSTWTNDDDASPIGSSLGESNMRNHTLTQELRATGNAAKVLDYTVGGFLLDQVTTYESHQILDYAIPETPFEFIQNDPVHEKDYAAFANATWHIVDALDFNAGVRYTHEDKEYTYIRDNPTAVQDMYGVDSIFFTPPLTGTSATYEGSKVDWRANLDYRWNDNLMTYASVSTGFKGGGVNPRPFEASQVEKFAPEDLTSYELGAKTDFLDRSLRVNISTFYEKYKDIQVTLLSCPEFSGGNAAEPCAAPTNGGDANIYGAELEASYHLGGFSVDASASKQHFEYTSVVAAAGIPLSAAAPDFQPLKFSLGAQYEIPVWAAATLTPRLDFTFASGFFTNANNDAESYVAGHQELNGRLTYKPATGGWELSVLGTNLTDKLWYTSVFDLSATQGQVYGLPAAPRSIEVEFKKNF